MIKNKNQEDQTLDDLRNLLATGNDEKLRGWLYPLVTRRFKRSDAQREYGTEAFMLATSLKNLTTGLAGAATVQAFANYITRATRWRFLDILRKTKRQTKNDHPYDDERYASEPEPHIAQNSYAEMRTIFDEAAAFLTPMEGELLELMRRGMKPKQIAVALNRKPGTIWNRCSKLRKKLDDIRTKFRNNRDRE